jgi:hypothetical protein
MRQYQQSTTLHEHAWRLPGTCPAKRIHLTICVRACVCSHALRTRTCTCTARRYGPPECRPAGLRPRRRTCMRAPLRDVCNQSHAPHPPNHVSGGRQCTGAARALSSPVRSVIDARKQTRSPGTARPRPSSPARLPPSRSTRPGRTLVLLILTWSGEPCAAS